MNKQNLLNKFESFMVVWRVPFPAVLLWFEKKLYQIKKTIKEDEMKNTNKWFWIVWIVVLAGLVTGIVIAYLVIPKMWVV